MTTVSAIRSDGVIRDATVVMNDAMDVSTFLNYVKQCLAPSLRPGDVVVMDNPARTRWRAGVRRVVPAAVQPRSQPHRDALEQSQGVAA